MDEHQYIRIYCTSCGHSFDVPRPCRNRFCPICSRTRIRLVRQKLTLIVDSLKSIPRYRVRHLVLTLPSAPELNAGARHLIKSFRRLRQRTWFKSKVTGGAFVIEVTGFPGRWHIHLHAILHCRFLDVYKLSEIWEECSGGRIVFVKNLPPSAIIKYLTKYLAKNGAPEQYHKEVSSAFKGLRLFNTFGNWHSKAKSLVKEAYSCPQCDATNFISSGQIMSAVNQLRKHKQIIYPSCGLRSPPG